MSGHASRKDWRVKKVDLDAPVIPKTMICDASVSL
jgi:hypothetical protein